MKLATTVARWTSRAHTKRPKYNFISSLLNPYCTNYAQFRRFYSIEDNVGNCWKCSNKQPSNSLFCQNSNCAVVNRLTIADDSNLFDLFGLESKFDIDASYLDAQYRNLQTQLHPDRFATKSSAEKEASSESSSTINRAYQILKAPLQRAAHLVHWKYGVNIFDESSINQQDSFMMEVFELRSKVESCSSKEELSELKTHISSKIDKLQENLNVLISDDRKDDAIYTATKLVYYSKTLEELDQSRFSA